MSVAPLSRHGWEPIRHGHYARAKWAVCLEDDGPLADGSDLVWDHSPRGYTADAPAADDVDPGTPAPSIGANASMSSGLESLPRGGADDLPLGGSDGDAHVVVPTGTTWHSMAGSSSLGGSHTTSRESSSWEIAGRTAFGPYGSIASHTACLVAGYLGEGHNYSPAAAMQEVRADHDSSLTTTAIWGVRRSLGSPEPLECIARAAMECIAVPHAWAPVATEAPGSRLAVHVDHVSAYLRTSPEAVLLSLADFPQVATGLRLQRSMGRPGEPPRGMYAWPEASSELRRTVSVASSVAVNSGSHMAAVRVLDSFATSKWQGAIRAGEPVHSQHADARRLTEYSAIILRGVRTANMSHVQALRNFIHHT